MRAHGILLGVTLALLGALRAGAAPTEPITLRLRLQAGKTYRIRMISDQEIRQTFQGREMRMDQTLGLGYRFAVTGVDAAGTASVTVTYDSILWRQRGPSGVIEYDSTHPPATIPPAARGFAAMVGQGFTMRLTSGGRVEALEGIAQFNERMIERMELPPGPERDALSAMLKEQFGDPAIREAMEQMLAIYPPRPVGVGDTWGKRVAITHGFPIFADNKWTLIARGNGVSTIQVRSQVKANTQTTPLQMGPAAFRYVLSGRQEGTLGMEEATGWTRHATLHQALHGRVTMQGSPQAPSGMSWPISIKSEIRLTSE